jgi:Glycosyl transferases group 1
MNRAMGAGALDVLVVSLGSTPGLRASDAWFADSLRRAGASVELACAAPPRRRLRTFALTDLAWALAARRAAREALGRHRPRAVVYSSTTASLLWPRSGAIRFDAPSAGNRPGRHGLWQRPLERRRLAQAPLLIPLTEESLAEVPAQLRARSRALALPIPVAPSGGPAGERDVAAITYAANPSKKGLDRVLAAWGKARRPGEELLVAGASDEEILLAGAIPAALAGGSPAGRATGAAGVRVDLSARLQEAGIRVVGRLAPEEYRALLRRTRVFVCAARREDYGLAQLEALADGCVLVTTPSPGPYAALPIARALDRRLVGEDLPAMLRAALDEPLPDYSARAATALEPFRPEAVDRRVREQLLPELLGRG